MKTVTTATVGAESVGNKQNQEAAPKAGAASPLLKLTPDQKGTLKKCEQTIRKAATSATSAIRETALAVFQIKEEKLYRESHATFEAYFRKEWGYSRSHTYRIAEAGEIIKRVSPGGDMLRWMTTESHFRPLAGLSPEMQDAILEKVAAWAAMAGQNEVPPKTITAAAALLRPADGPKIKTDKKCKLTQKFLAVIDDIKQKLPKDSSKEIHRLFDQLTKKTNALNNPARSTGIDWTDATWNPLQGCARASAGCDHCYAAKLVATRLADVYPGLAKEINKDGKKGYIFNNVIKLLPEHLADPLLDRTPKRYFVNSMSDLFHDKVHEDFIAAVFDVMEKATWHQFQVLTKRPKRMADFTTARYKDKHPPANVWLGVSTEDQNAFDERYPHLERVKAAVRWLSVEPLIGPLTPLSLAEVDWVVVGGESGSNRKMEKAWVKTLHAACEKAGIPFYFKQWGDFGEDGRKAKKKKKDGLTPAASLDGVIYDAYPVPRLVTRTTETK